MSALGFQTVFARMLASPSFLESVRADPDAALSPYPLTDTERAQLAALPMERFDWVARSMVSGKVSFLLSGVPSTLRRLLPTAVLTDSLTRFLDVHPGRGLHPYDEGVRFLLGWLDGDLGRNALALPLWAREAIRFERLRSETMLGPRPVPVLTGPLEEVVLLRHPGWCVERFHFDLPALLAARSAEERAALVEVPREQWWYLQRSHPIQVLPAHPMLGAISRLADGTRTGRSLMDEVASQFAGDPLLQPDVRLSVRETVEELAHVEGCLVEAGGAARPDVGPG